MTLPCESGVIRQGQTILCVLSEDLVALTTVLTAPVIFHTYQHGITQNKV